MSDHKPELTYKDGTLDVPHWGISLRTLFGAAIRDHDVVKMGRRVQVTLKGVYIGEIQLNGKSLPNDKPATILQNPQRR